MNELKGHELRGWTHVPARVAALARKDRRTEIVALIFAFNEVVTRPGGARRARSILDWTIALLDGTCREGERRAGPGAEAASADDQARVRILEELKAVRALWRSSELTTSSPDLEHAMDALLMYEVTRAEAVPSEGRARRFSVTSRAHGYHACSTGRTRRRIRA